MPPSTQLGCNQRGRSLRITISMSRPSPALHTLLLEALAGPGARSLYGRLGVEWHFQALTLLLAVRAPGGDCSTGSSLGMGRPVVALLVLQLGARREVQPGRSLPGGGMKLVPVLAPNWQAAGAGLQSRSRVKAWAHLLGIKEDLARVSAAATSTLSAVLQPAPVQAPRSEAARAGRALGRWKDSALQPLGSGEEQAPVSALRETVTGERTVHRGCLAKQAPVQALAGPRVTSMSSPVARSAPRWGPARVPACPGA